MSRIKQLSVNLINQIAAGEVIERPASVVKELAENSIDAGASKIEISVSNSCRNIRIADNGSGIHPDDIQLAFTKHATSKLSDEQSLFNIQTLGFRGEALASIISIAKVTCTTRTKDFEYGTKVESQNSVVKASKTGCAQGTIMEVTDLFFNQPARLKFLKSEKTEFTYIQELVQTLAISHPKIAFILKNNGSTVISTTTNADLLTRITEVYSTDIINELKEINKEDKLSKIRISGYASVPSYTRSSKKSIYTFVNNRMVKCPIILKAIDMAYKNMMPSGRYPFVILNLDINPEDVDVNVHPTKKEVRYKNPNQIFSFVQSAIDYALNAIKNEYIHKEPDSNIANFATTFNQKFPQEEAQEKEDAAEIFPFKVNSQSKEAPVFAAKEFSPVQKTMEIKFDTPEQVKKINVIGQFKNTYILVENEDNLEIIDQHIAEERFIYEKLKKQKEVASQLLIVSDVLDVEAGDVDLLENSKQNLAKFGYQIEKISDTQVIFKKIPQVLSEANLKDVLSELLRDLKDSPDNDLDSREEKILITTSCKASIKAGDKLTIWQMENIVKNLRTTKNPYTCPHGRPISHFIPYKEVAAFFARNV
jgi:DNA mismatch repair protein MutL